MPIGDVDSNPMEEKMMTTSTPSEKAPSTTGSCPFGGADQPMTLPLPRETALAAPPAWAELRGGCPVAHVTMPTGENALMLTRHADVRHMLSDPRFVRRPLPSATAQGSQEGSPAAAFAGISQGEGHMRWRRLLSRTFTTKRVMALQPGMRTIAHQLVDTMEEIGAPADVRAILGFPLPVFVICDLLGVPVEDRSRFAYWSDRMLSLTRFSDEEMAASGAEFWQYMLQLVRSKRAQPGEDLLSELTTVVDSQDGQLSEAELIVTAQSILVAGHETTANMIGKMVAMLLSRRERWEQLLADQSLVRSAVEEVLRFDANLGLGVTRLVTEDTAVGDVAVPAGSMVVNAMPAANRDAQVFADPEQMDLSRSPNPHLTFGAGLHTCLGQALARVELQTVLEVLLERLPTLELAAPESELEALQGLLVGGLTEVPVRW